MINRRSVGAALKVGISIALVWFILDSVGAKDAFARLMDADPLWLAAAVAIAMVQILICTLRWCAVLSGLGAALTFRLAMKFWYIGAFFNQALPSGAGGDVVRGYLAYKKGVALPHVLSSLFLDRAATVLALVVLVAAMLPFAPVDMENGRLFGHVVWVLLAVAILGLVFVMLLDRSPEKWTRFKFIRALHHLAGDTRRVLLHPVIAARLMVWSLLGHVNLVLVVFILFKALNVEIALSDCLLLFPPVLLVQAVPISIAGWGVREGAMVALFALAQVPSNAALAVSILFGLTLMVTSIPGAILWLSSPKDINADEVEAFADEAS